MPKPETSLATFLRSVAVFGGLEGRSLENITKVLEEKNYSAGQTIFSEGELGRTARGLGRCARRDGVGDAMRDSDEPDAFPVAGR